MHRSSPRLPRQSCVIMHAVFVGAVACRGDRGAPMVGPVTQQFITAASVGNTKGTRRSDVPPDPVARTQLVARFLHRTTAGGTGLIAIQSPQAVGRLILTSAGDGPLTGLSVGTVPYQGRAPRARRAAPALSRTTAPATLSVSALTLGLPDGVYTASIPVRSSLTNVVAKTLRVRIVVKQ